MPSCANVLLLYQMPTVSRRMAIWKSEPSCPCSDVRISSRTPHPVGSELSWSAMGIEYLRPLFHQSWLTLPQMKNTSGPAPPENWVCSVCCQVCGGCKKYLILMSGCCGIHCSLSSLSQPTMSH